MRKVSRIAGIILILLLMWSQAATSVNAAVWEFGSEGPGQNPFTPRGYLVETEKGQYWLSSPYDNNGFYVSYTGSYNGVDYLPAKKSDGSDYTFYAMTDRNPWTDNSDRIGYGAKYFFAYKNGARISNFTDYIKTPATRGDSVDPSGQGTCWVFKIEGLVLEPGCRYEFGFLRGMQSNNGITLVLAENEKGEPTGYIQETDEGLTAAEKSKYNSEKYNEFEFISSWYKNEDGDGYKVNTVPMRFTVQTYADLTEWEQAAASAEEFLDSVTESDLENGKYVRENITQLDSMISLLNKKAEEQVKYMLQTQADPTIRSMITELNRMLEKARSEKPEPADMDELLRTIDEAESLYAKASVNIGNDVGQYGQIEVDALSDEIESAKKLNEFYPQSDIDNQVESLKNAMTEVRASKVMEEQMIFYDKVTGIYVIAPASSLPENTTLAVRVMGEETEDYRSMQSNLSENETEAVFYRMQFYDGDEKIQPGKTVEIQIPVDDRISQKNSCIYSVSENGSLTKVASANANGVQIFKAETVSAFVLAGSAATEEEKAAAKGEKMREIMNQKEDVQEDNKETQLEEEKRKKEEAKDPLNKILERNENNATFSNDVRRETDPIYLVYIAVLLAVIAAAMALRRIVETLKK